MNPRRPPASGRRVRLRVEPVPLARRLARLEMAPLRAHHSTMWIAFVCLLGLAGFTLMPLPWLAVGLPWMPLVVTFGLIPLLDAVVGVARSGRPVGLQRLPERVARWREEYAAAKTRLCGG